MDVIRPTLFLFLLMRFVWHFLLVLDKYDSLTGNGPNPLDCKEIKSVNPKENQSLIVTGRTNAEALVHQPPDVKSWHPDAGKDWRQEEKGTTEDEMVGWHHWLNGHEFEQTPGDDGGAWRASVHGVTKNWTQLSNWTTTIKYPEWLT